MVEAALHQRLRWKIAALSFREIGAEVTHHEVADLANAVWIRSGQEDFCERDSIIDQMIASLDYCRWVIHHRSELESFLNYPPYDQTSVDDAH